MRRNNNTLLRLWVDLPKIDGVTYIAFQKMEEYHNT